MRTVMKIRRNRADKPDELRRLVLSYMGCLNQDMLLSPVLLERLEEGGSFASAFHKLMIDPARVRARDQYPPARRD